MVHDTLRGSETGTVTFGARNYNQNAVISSKNGLIIFSLTDDTAIARQTSATVITSVVKMHLTWFKREYLEPRLLV